MEQPFPGKFFKLRIPTTVIGIGINAYAAPRGENPGHLQVFGVHQPDEILHYNIDTIFVKCAMITETEQIQLQAFTFNHLHCGNIINPDSSKIGLTCYGTQTGELRTIKSDPIIVAGMLVFKRFEYFRSIVIFIFGFPAKQRQLFFFLSLYPF